MRFLSLATACVLSSCATCLAQALNVNFAGVLGPNPGDSYGAAADQPGYWNPVDLDDPLFTLDGSPTSARIAVNGGGDISDIPGASDDDASLMETVFIMAKGSNSLFILDLEPGFYDLYLYMWGAHFQGEDRNTYRLYNGVDFSAGGVSFGRDWPGGHVQGVTYTTRRFEVLPQFRGFSLTFESFNADAAYVNGLQLVPVPAPSALFVVPLAGLIACRRRR